MSADASWVRVCAIDEIPVLGSRVLRAADGDIASKREQCTVGFRDQLVQLLRVVGPDAIGLPRPIKRRLERGFVIVAGFQSVLRCRPNDLQRLDGPRDSLGVGTHRDSSSRCGRRDRGGR